MSRATDDLVAHFPASQFGFPMRPQVEKFLSDSQRRAFEKGRAEGIATSRAAAVLDVLDARALPVSEAQRERILGCTDLDLLKTWHRRAVTVASADQLFE